MNARIPSWRRLGVVLVTLVLITGAASGCSGTAKTPATSTTLQTGTGPLPTGTVKGLELLDYKQLPVALRANIDGWQAASGRADDGPQLTPGTYKSFLSTSHLSRAETIVGSSNGLSVKQVVLTFDAVGTAELRKVTQTAVGDAIIVVLNGKIIDYQQMQGPITTGTIQLTSPTAAAAVEKAIVPAL